MLQAYSEDQLVEQPAIALFQALGWQTVNAMEEVFGLSGTLGRETSGEVVLFARLRAAITRFNPLLPPEAVNTAIDELTRERSAMPLELANREVYQLLKEGIKVSIPDQEHGGQKVARAQVIDWDRPEENDFLLVSQFSVTGALYTCRPDLVGFVNGLPFVVIELKKPGVPARAAFDDNLTSYKHPQNGIPALFVYNAFLVASNGTESKMGSITAGWERFYEWKRIEREDEPRRVSLEVMLRSTCGKSRLLDIVENFTLFSEHKAGVVKVIAQNHQYLGVINAIVSMHAARERGHGRAGVFWQAPASGKSFSMVFFAQKILRKVQGDWRFVIVTDRVELDDQIAKTFKACGAVSEAEGNACHASSGAHLRELLRGNHRYVFTLIHKFQKPEMLCDRPDVIVITDEAHRTQYDTLAVNMRAALPKAMFLAFTGTPLIAGEERTREVFGDYVSIYDFQQSVEDGATVPLFYENRTPELKLVNPKLNDEIYDLIETASLDPDQEVKLERELGRQYHILTRDDRLETVAQDIVNHFLGRGFMGKAMVVSIDKATALRVHDKVRKYWEQERSRVKKELEHYDLPPEKTAELRDRLKVLDTTDMALIVSPGQNEVEQMRSLGLDIVPHRQRMNDEPLDEKFKDPNDPLGIVFLCAMWLTGFDAPSCSTVYLDKPMRNHTLIQTINRASRVFPGKHSGVIVDYANVFLSLEKALAIYGGGSGPKNPVKEKSALVGELRKAVSDATEFCTTQKVDLDAIEKHTVGSLARLQMIDDAVNALISPDKVRRDLLGHAKLVSILFRAIKPSPAAVEFAGRVACIDTIASAITAKLGPGQPDISTILSSINKILDDSIAGVAVREDETPALDLSKVDFKALSARFKKSKHRNTELEALKAAIRAQLEKLIRQNRTRADYAGKFEALIESYNAGSRNIEELFDELVKLSNSLSEEQQRHVRENLSEEELVIFDILTRPAPDMRPEERNEVKKVARLLIQRLRDLLVINWRQKSAARSKMRIAIEDTLDTLPPVYDRKLYTQKCSVLFEHIYESYPEKDVGVFSMTA
jgi:type I restriction enzyme R subunit